MIDHSSISGSLLNPKVEVDSLTCVQGAEQRGEFGRRGRTGKGVPAAFRPVRRGSQAHTERSRRGQHAGALGVLVFPPAPDGASDTSTGGESATHA